MKKVMLFVGALVLVLTTAVSAQCPGGWVLWSNRLIQTSGDLWFPFNGYPSYTTCDAGQTKLEERQRALLKSGTLTLDKAAIYACFPSDFAPREKK